MITRSLQPKDIEAIRQIHENHFKEEFEFGYFTDFMSSFVVVDDDDHIIVAGGVKPIAESVLITNKDYNMTKIGRALMDAMEISSYIGRKFNFDQLHAFIQNESFGNHLIQHGFRNTKGKSLVLDLR